MENRRSLYTFGIFVGLFLVAAIYTVWARENGLRHAGKLEVVSPYYDAEIYVDNEKVGSASNIGDSFVTSLSQGDHSVIVAKNGYWPWMKNITTKEDATNKLFPFAARTSPNLSAVSVDDPEYQKLESLAMQSGVPGEFSKAQSPDQKVFVWSVNNTIYSEVNGVPCTVLASVETIRKINFYAGRSDVLIFAAGEGVYLLEIDKIGGQNFQPIYKGLRPGFYQSPNGTLYIADQGVVAKLTI